MMVHEWSDAQCGDPVRKRSREQKERMAVELSLSERTPINDHSFLGAPDTAFYVIMAIVPSLLMDKSNDHELRTIESIFHQTFMNITYLRREF
jgi:hypothetical protein